MSIANATIKPIGRKNYGSIGHLPTSRLGPADHAVTEGQATIATLKARDWRDLIVVQEKLDGSNVGVAKHDGRLFAITRAGYEAHTSPYEQHHVFDRWVQRNAKRFDRVLQEGERLAGEWLYQAHGTIYYDGINKEPFVAFDLMQGDRRLTFGPFMERICSAFDTPRLLHIGGPIPVAMALHLHDRNRHACDEIEGVVYRVERDGKVDFLAKYVRPDKIDGKYLPEISGEAPHYNFPEVPQ